VWAPLLVAVVLLGVAAAHAPDVAATIKDVLETHGSDVTKEEVPNCPTMPGHAPRARPHVAPRRSRLTRPVAAG
jgi:hypothetical protein